MTLSSPAKNPNQNSAASRMKMNVQSIGVMCSRNSMFKVSKQIYLLDQTRSTSQSETSTAGSDEVWKIYDVDRAVFADKYDARELKDH